MNFEKRLSEELKKLDESPMPSTQPRRLPQAPPKTIPRPSRTPQPNKSPKPWNPPRPKVDPTPKNEKPNRQTSESAVNLLAILCEAYEDEADQSTVDFWRKLKGGKHQFSKHPILSTFGDELSSSSYGHTSGRAKKAGLQGKPNQNYRQRVIQAITQLESQHLEELVELAKRITVHIWDCPPEILNGKLTTDVERNEADDSGDADETLGTDNPDIDKQINKRITMNALTHGSSVNAMLTLHHMVDKEINAIDPRLLILYNKLSAGSHQEYWMINIPDMFEMMAVHAGSSSVKYDSEQPSVDARAVCFPVLAQEMSKGVAELLSHHGLSDLDEPTTREVLGKADAVKHEPYLIQVGPEIWRRFLAVRPRDIPLAQLYQALAMQPPDELHRIIYTVIKEPDEAMEILSALVAEPENFDIDDIGSEEEHYDTGSGWVDKERDDEEYA